MPIHVGFTGTQLGMTDVQKRQLRDYVLQLRREWGGVYLHHGECIGADAEADEICNAELIPTIGHPPVNRKKWHPYCHCKVRRAPREYKDRNQDIVNETGLLIAAPRTRLEQLRSGTWMTIRFARHKGKLIVMLDPEEPLELPRMARRQLEIPRG